MTEANYTVNLYFLFYALYNLSVRLEIREVVSAVIIPFMPNNPVTLSSRQCMSYKSKLTASATIFLPPWTNQ